MKRIITLTKTMVKVGFGDTVSMPSAKTKRAKIGRIFLYAFLAIYLVGFLGVMSYGLIQQLITFGQPSLAIFLYFMAITMISAFFALIMVPGVFYFSNDIERYLVLPLKPYEILCGKLFGALMSMYQLVLPVGLTFIAIYSYLVGFNVIAVFWLIIGTILSPLFALGIISALIMILFRFIPFFKNKDLFTYGSTIVIVIISGWFGFSTSLAAEGGLDSLIASIASGDNAIINMISSIVPTINFFSQAAVANQWLLGLLGIITALLGSLGILYILQPLYFSSVVGIGERKSKKKALNASQLAKSSSQGSVTKALFKYDMRRVFRTPVFMTNYYLGIVIIPLFMVVPVMLSGELSWHDISKFAIELQTMIQVFPLHLRLFYPFVAAFLFAALLAGFSTVSSTAFSREGKMMTTMRAMPFSLKSLLNAKLWFSTLTLGIVPGLVLAIIALVLRFDIITVGLVLIGSFAGAMCASTIGLMSDLLFPRLSWENEIDAVKGNFMSILPMFALMGIYAGLGFLISKTSYASDINSIALIYVVLTIVIGVLCYLASLNLLEKKFIKAIEEL